MSERVLRSFLWAAMFFIYGLFAFMPSAQAAEAVANQSHITTGQANTTVVPYQSFSVTIDLRNANGGTLSSTPPGKLYIWATDEESFVSDGLDVVARSLGENVYMHQTERQGVLIMDAAALIQPQQFNLNLARRGTYELHVLYMPTGAIDPANVTNYWSYELTGASLAERTVVVEPTPARDVAMMVISTRISGILVDSIPVTNPRNQTVSSAISVERTGATPTEVQLTLLRENGLSVGADVPVYINVMSNSVSSSNVLVRTDGNGIARFRLNGLVASGNNVQLRLDLADAPVVVPLSAYTYRPEKVRFNIGSNIIDVDDRTIQIDTAAIVQSGRTYVPYRAIGELLGASVDYDGSVRTITTTFEDKTLTMTIGYNNYAVNGTIYQMDATPYINSDGRTMVPIRFVAEVMGYDVQAVKGANGLTASVVFTRR